MKTRKELAQLFKGTGAEIGVERGAFSKEILKHCTKLYLVDPWKFVPGYRDHVSQKKLDQFYLETARKFELDNTIIIRDFSVNAAKKIDDGSLDFVYIDARHDEESVTEDLHAWYPKVKQGGIVSGHDYNLLDVVHAVRRFCEETGGMDLEIWSDDTAMSWSFIKP